MTTTILPGLPGGDPLESAQMRRDALQKREEAWPAGVRFLEWPETMPYMTRGIGQRSELYMSGCHLHLKEVMRLAHLYSRVPFSILEAGRTEATHAMLVRDGASTLAFEQSRHAPDADRTVFAVDVQAYVNGKPRVDGALYATIAAAVKKAAEKLGVPIEWGGDSQGDPDPQHFQLPWADYPPAVRA
jgi:hypothetical protein